MRKQAFGEQPTFYTEKIYMRLGDNMMKERANQQKLKKAQAYMSKDFELLKEILELKSDDEVEQSNSLYAAMHY